MKATLKLHRGSLELDGVRDDVHGFGRYRRVRIVVSERGFGYVGPSRETIMLVAEHEPTDPDNLLRLYREDMACRRGFDPADVDAQWTDEEVVV